MHKFKVDKDTKNNLIKLLDNYTNNKLLSDIKLKLLNSNEIELTDEESNALILIGLAHNE